MIKILQWCWQSGQSGKFRSRPVKNLIVSIKIIHLTSNVAFFLHSPKTTTSDLFLKIQPRRLKNLKKGNDSPPRLHFQYFPLKSWKLLTLFCIFSRRKISPKCHKYFLFCCKTISTVSFIRFLRSSFLALSSFDTLLNCLSRLPCSFLISYVSLQIPFQEENTFSISNSFQAAWLSVGFWSTSHSGGFFTEKKYENTS